MVSVKQEPQPRDHHVKRILVRVLVLNLLVAASKIGVGLSVRSLAILADGIHSLTDAASNVIGLVGMSVAERPPDQDHPYGHRRFETLSALFIGGMLALTAWEILRAALHRWRGGEEPAASPASLGVMVVAIAVSLAVSAYEARQGRRLRSEILVADAAHTRSDIGTSAVVLVSLLGSRAGIPHLDLVAALVVTALIAKAAYEIVGDSVRTLSDVAQIPEERVIAVAVEVPGVLGAHKVRSRGGLDGGHCDLHVQVDALLPLDRAHVIGHLVGSRLETELGFADVVVHVEPPEGHRTDWLPEEEESLPSESRPGSGAVNSS